MILLPICCAGRRAMLAAVFVPLVCGSVDRIPIVAADQAEQAEQTSELSHPPPELINFAIDIRPILDAKCLECHGPKKASNDFRVDQRESVLDLVVPGDPQSSSLWTDYLVTDDDETRMPPKKHDLSLTGAELAAIRTWIEEGAKWNEDVAAVEPVPQAEIEPPPQTRTNPPPPAPDPLLLRFWEFQGYFHPATVHFPVALLIMAAIFGVGSLFYRESFELAAFHCLWIGAISSVVACLMGWSFADTRGYGNSWNFDWNKDLDARHRWMGIALAVASVIVTLIAIRARRRKSPGLRAIWLCGMLLTAALVGLVGHQGGELVYGERMYDDALKMLLGTAAHPVEPVENLSMKNSGINLPESGNEIKR